MSKLSFRRPAPHTVVTLLLFSVNVLLFAAQFDYNHSPNFRYGPLDQDLYMKLSLHQLQGRIADLAALKDPLDRDRMCFPLTWYGRHLDRSLDSQARVFINGVLGKGHGNKMSVYIFLRNYLYPRTVEISLDGKAVLLNDGFDGITTSSQDELRAHGFDLLVQLNPTNTQIDLIPLTQKGVLK